MNTLTNGKANRQRKNAKKYEVTKIKVERKKKDKAKKAETTKASWIKKDKKKNGRLVKGGASHKEHLAEKVSAEAVVEATAAMLRGEKVKAPVQIAEETVYPPEA